MVEIILRILSLTFLLIAPLVAFPLAMVLKKGRQAIDKMINWKGNKREQMESVEDTLTHGVTWTLAISVLIGIGTIYVWYVHAVALPTHPWLFSLLDRFPWVDLRTEFVNLGVVAYWTIVYILSFALGWSKAGRG